MTTETSGKLAEAAREALRAAIGGTLVRRGDGEAVVHVDEQSEWIVHVDSAVLVEWLEDHGLRPDSRAWREFWSDVHVDGMETMAMYGVAGSPFRFEPGFGLSARPGAPDRVAVEAVEGEWFAYPPDSDEPRLD